MLTKSLLVLAAAASTPYAGELKEQLNRPVAAAFQTPKKAYDLEVCIADVLTIMGTPTSFRDGPDDVILAASVPGSGTYSASATIKSTSNGSMVELRIRGKGWDDRLRSRIEHCL